jgi:hypothetical protein
VLLDGAASPVDGLADEVYFANLRHRIGKSEGK